MHTLLLADDSITVQRVIALTFAGEPIQVVSVGNGQQAMEKMAAERPDIVLAGTTLPGVNGYDLAKYMRSKTELRDVPVVLLSGAFELVDDAQLASSGADGIIEKPLEPTTVIGRVKELLGLKSDAKPAAPVGRTITSPGAGGGRPDKDGKPPEKKLPAATLPRAVMNTHGAATKPEQLRSPSSAAPNNAPVEDSATRPADYLDTLDSAFDTLDQQLSGRAATMKPRNPSGPLSQSPGAADPRSPGRAPTGEPAAGGNPIFEVDDDWFGGDESQARADARAGRREIAEDLQAAGLQVPAKPAAANPIFEVDDEWFKEDEQARAAKLEQQRELAASTGVHDVDLPVKDAKVTADPPAAPAAPAALSDDFAALLASERAVTPAAPPPEIRVVAPVITDAMLDHIASRVAPPQITDAMLDHIASRVAPPQITAAMLDHIASRVAPPQITDAMLDHIASRVAPPQITDAMLDHIASRVPAPQITDAMLGQISSGVAAPEISEQMLDQIASRVADRLTSSAFGEQLREQLSAALRDTVRGVVSETSERLVRDEIERIKNKR